MTFIDLLNEWEKLNIVGGKVNKIINKKIIYKVLLYPNYVTIWTKFLNIFSNNDSNKEIFVIEV